MNLGQDPGILKLKYKSIKSTQLIKLKNKRIVLQILSQDFTHNYKLDDDLKVFKEVACLLNHRGRKKVYTE